MWNKTLKANAKKTKSAPKVSVAVVSGVAAMALTVAASVLAAHSRPVGYPSPPNNRIPCVIQIPKDCISLEVADTPEKRTGGLSGRGFLPRNQGMLFVFDSPGEQCIWMKNMHFSIDIVWLSQQKEIIKIKKNVLPATYPQTFCANPAAYVIELSPGIIDLAGLNIGRRIQF